MITAVILTNILFILKGILLGWFITNFEPIKVYIIGTLEGLNLAHLNHYKNEFIYSIVGQMINGFTCLKCCSFLMTLILSHNIYLSIVAAILAMYYDRWFSNTKMKL